ncbi:conserved protein of unknown function [Nitrospira japonica]|uniref:Uncharacterized protein n=2 Tax=Nitrospira japonica TaxID=1325564 RepID=A0A1W1I7Q7_9BACT|nr:conserved protein of unknown function [Nitrospira japonica]
MICRILGLSSTPSRSYGLLYNPPMLIRSLLLLLAVATSTMVLSAVSAGAEGRAPSQHVGSAMALLATLEDARILPPEGTPEANHVIRVVIQFQSVFAKSTNPAVHEFFHQALVTHVGEAQAAPEQAAFAKTGWTGTVLAALAERRRSADPGDLEKLAAGFSAFNLTLQDFEFLTGLFDQARREYRNRGREIEEVFAERRRDMPGGRS